MRGGRSAKGKRRRRRLERETGREVRAGGFQKAHMAMRQQGKKEKRFTLANGVEDDGGRSGGSRWRSSRAARQREGEKPRELRREERFREGE